MKKLPITLCVITRNSSDRIEGMLKKHKAVVSEIMVVDQSSTDGTYEKASKVADVVLKRRCKGTADPDRNFLFQLAGNPWVLYLDDDEYLSPKTIKALPKLVNDKNVDIYWLKETNLVDGIDIHELSGDDPHPRLFRKGSMKYIDQQTNVDHTYPEPAPDAKVSFVDYDIIHDRTMEKLIASNRNRNKVATPEQIAMQEDYISKVEDFLRKREKQKN